jgi:hypothetical protein
MPSKLNSEYCRDYRERLNSDPEKRAERRRKDAERQRLHRKKKSLSRLQGSVVTEEIFPDDWTEEDIEMYREERLAIHEHGGG